MEELIPIRMTRVTSNDRAPLIYLPKEARRLLGLEIGVPVVIYVDLKSNALIVKRIEIRKGSQDEKA